MEQADCDDWVRAYSGLLPIFAPSWHNPTLSSPTHVPPLKRTLRLVVWRLLLIQWGPVYCGRIRSRPTCHRWKAARWRDNLKKTTTTKNSITTPTHFNILRHLNVSNDTYFAVLPHLLPPKTCHGITSLEGNEKKTRTIKEQKRVCHYQLRFTEKLPLTTKEKRNVVCINTNMFKETMSWKSIRWVLTSHVKCHRQANVN